MEVTIILLAAVALFLFYSLMKLCGILKDERKKNEDKQKVLDFFYATTNRYGTRDINLKPLLEMEVDTLKTLQHQLSVCYRSRLIHEVFDDEDLPKIYWQIATINPTSPSPQKDFIEENFKNTVFGQSAIYISDLIYATIKKKNLQSFEHGYAIEKFFLEDVEYLKSIDKDKILAIVIALASTEDSIGGPKDGWSANQYRVCHDLKKTIELLRNL